MRYYIIHKHPSYENAPQLIGWSAAIDVRNICPGKSHLLKSRQLFMIRGNPRTVFTDVISHPFFLVSETVKQTIEMYDKSILYKQAVLLDAKHEQAVLYYLPILRRIDCLKSASRLNRDRSVIHKAVLDKAKIGDEVIFKIGNVGGSHIVIRLDLAESILRRETRGIGLNTVEIV